jgi:ABC-type transport system involved in multi-copper enzyme maturation permease subunit
MIITRVTLREMLGRKVLLWGAVMSAVFIGLYVFGLSMVRGQIGVEELDRAATSFLVSFSLYIVSFLGSFLGLVLSAGSVASEVDGGVIHAVLARPITRRRWLVERWVGICGLVAGYTVAMGWLMALAADLILVYQPESLTRALAFMALQATIMVTLGVFLSTRLSAVATGVVLFALFGLAWLGGIIELLGDVFANQGMVNAGIVTSLIMPTDGVWRAASYYASEPAALGALLSDGPPFLSGSPPAPAFVAWALGYVVMFGALALRRFARRDL